MPKTIALVSCVSKKINKQSPAKELYRSDWFNKASRYAESISDKWYILSAKYGLLSPEQLISPYNETLNRMPIGKRRDWAHDVCEDLGGILSTGDRVIILAGVKYREFLVDPILQLGCEVEIPMEGLKIGEQLSWLKKQLEMSNDQSQI